MGVSHSASYHYHTRPRSNGNWAGTTNHLDYIANLNFLAIWTSPITSQSPAGYHGYWYVSLGFVIHILVPLPSCQANRLVYTKPIIW